MSSARADNLEMLVQEGERDGAFPHEDWCYTDTRTAVPVHSLMPFEEYLPKVAASLERFVVISTITLPGFTGMLLQGFPTKVLAAQAMSTNFFNRDALPCLVFDLDANVEVVPQVVLP